MADKGASILAKLKKKAKDSGMNYQQCLQLFFQEEFLRRLSKSRYADNLVLRGGLFIYTLPGFESRATIDIDFLLRRMDSDLTHIYEVITEILETPTGHNDVMLLRAKKSEPISVQRKYHGVSTQITGSIKNVRVPFNVDIGVGDVIVPKAEKRTIQTQLNGYDVPEVYTYSLESTIAEKLDAILQRFELTGRMKDFYDIYYLARTFDFDGRSLQEAVAQTLETRGTPYERDSFERMLQLVDDDDMRIKWHYFLKNIGGKELPFADVMKTIGIFLAPVFASIVNENEWLKKWRAESQVWHSIDGDNY